MSNRRASAWVKNATTQGDNAGKKRIRVQVGTFTDTAKSGENHVEFYAPADEEAVLQRLAQQFGGLQVYRQLPNARKFKKAETIDGPKATKAQPATFKGQGTTCKGQLTITLSGPQGSGKSLVAKMLRDLLPLTPVNAVVIETQA